MTKKEFLQEVVQEAKNIKEHATEKEKDRLDFAWLDPSNVTRCIYGQMSGHCRSDRALELINKCTVRVWESPNGIYEMRDKSFTTTKNKINGTIAEGAKVTGGFMFLSLLEGYIAMKGAKNKELIEFIRGETEELSL